MFGRRSVFTLKAQERIVEIDIDQLTNDERKVLSALIDMMVKNRNARISDEAMRLLKQKKIGV